MLQRLRAFLDSLAQPWFPTLCLRCGQVGSSPCPECSEEFTPAQVVGETPELDAVVALVVYDEVSRPFIADLKFRGKWATVQAFAPAMSFLLDDCIGTERPGPVLTWAPTTPSRARQRGFDQAEVIARHVARYSGRPVRRLLDRQPGEHQTGRSRSERLTGIHFDPRQPVGGAIVVFDDVVTTGSTLSAAARALRSAGASAVVGVTLAATPDRPKC